MNNPSPEISREDALLLMVIMTLATAFTVGLFLAEFFFG
jgi:hypothetical protein